MRSIKFLFLALLFSTLTYSKVLTPNNFYKTIRSHKAVLVEFWAPWCPGCKMLKPNFHRAKQIAGKKVLFATYNIDLKGDILRRYNIEMIPTMVLFVDGKEVSRSNSILRANEIADWVLGYVP